MVPEKPTPLRVLVVDDEPLIRWSLAETLVDLGHSVSEAGDAAGAIEAVRSDEPDVIVLDYRLPDSNDLSLLARIREMAPASAVIMMTAYGTPEMQRDALALGAWRVVSKPFEVNEMAVLVRRAASGG